MVSIKDLTKTYGDFRLEVSMELPAGKVSGIVGRNGAGKSTLIKAILGLIEPGSGTVMTLGKDARKLGPADREKIGTVFPDSGFSTYLNVDDIVRILRRMYPAFDEQWFLDMCGKNGLPLDRNIKSFSTGMNAKLRVLVACSHGAKLLILDEPTSGLDVIAREQVLDLLREYLAEDPERSILISSHISTDLEGLCDDIYMIHNGRIIMHEDTDRILGEYAVLKLSDAAYGEIDRKYLIKARKESFGWTCFTDQKQYYIDNYPGAVIESCTVDDMIIMMTEGGDVE